MKTVFAFATIVFGSVACLAAEQNVVNHGIITANNEHIAAPAANSSEMIFAETHAFSNASAIEFCGDNCEKQASRKSCRRHRCGVLRRAASGTAHACGAAVRAVTRPVGRVFRGCCRCR